MIHGGRAVAATLKHEGIRHVFTLCGGHIQNIYDGCLDEGITVIDVRHEQSAGHAADAYSRVTNTCGVALVTAGPGVTDVVTAAANALRAQVPMLIIGGAGPMVNRHQGSLQDMDHVTLMKSVTKFAATVYETRRIPEMVTMAIRHAMTGVPGPVFLEIPLDVLMMPFSGSLEKPNGHSRPQSTLCADATSIEQVKTMLAKAQKPMLVVGSQFHWSPNQEALGTFLDTHPMPTFLSGMARGALPFSHPSLYRRVRKHALKESDLVLLCGTPFDFRLKYGHSIPSETQIVQVDLDANIIGHNRNISLGIVGDTGHFLASLQNTTSRCDPAWLASLSERDELSLASMAAEAQSESSPPNPLRVCAELAKHIDDDTIVIGDGGDFVATAAYCLPLRRPGLWMDPGPLGTLGVGPGYAMAAKLARPNSKVILVYGDGSFGLHAMEWEAMARQKINVVGIIGNDAGWTQILRGQEQIFGKERIVATKLDYTRYDQTVESLGCKGYWVEDVAALGPALDDAFRQNVPVLINVKIGKSDFRKNSLSV